MAYGGIAVPKNQSQICLITEAGAVLHQRIQTQREQFVAVCAERPQARILLTAHGGGHRDRLQMMRATWAVLIC
jgi:hypothetical protein